MRLVFLGAPGVGKGTQAARLAEKKGWAHISTGILLREAVVEGSPLGRRAQAALDRGDLVEDDVVLGLIAEVLGRGSNSGFILDGFPRTLTQAGGLDALLAGRGEKLDGVVVLTADVAEVGKRMARRGRTDDAPDVVRHRLQVYEQMTRPLVDFYEQRGLLARVDGMGSIEDIGQNVERALRLES